MLTTAVLTAALLCALPAAANATSTLLSGYGGPGEGNQAIIGATLVGGSSHGGGSSSGGGGSSGGGEASQLQSQGAAGVAAGAASGSGGSGTGGGGKSGRSGTGSAHRVSGAARARAQARAAAGLAATIPAADRNAGTSTLGLTGTDFVYVLLGFGVLLATALLTARVARGETRRGRG